MFPFSSIGRRHLVARCHSLRPGDGPRPVPRFKHRLPVQQDPDPGLQLPGGQGHESRAQRPHQQDARQRPEAKNHPGRDKGTGKRPGNTSSCVYSKVKHLEQDQFSDGSSLLGSAAMRRLRTWGAYWDTLTLWPGACCSPLGRGDLLREKEGSLKWYSWWNRLTRTAYLTEHWFPLLYQLNLDENKMSSLEVLSLKTAQRIFIKAKNIP